MYNSNVGRLRRLLFDTDNPEWRNYKKRLLKGNTRFSGYFLLILILIPVLYVAYYYFRINAAKPKGLPSGYIFVPMQDAYQVIKPIVDEWRGDAYLRSGWFQIYPDQNYHREPQGHLLFCSSSDATWLSFRITQIFEIFDISVYGGSDINYSFNASGIDQISIQDPVTMAPDNKLVLDNLLENGGNKFIEDHEHIGWPALLSFVNTAHSPEKFLPEWKICIKEGLFAPGQEVCFDVENGGHLNPSLIPTEDPAHPYQLPDSCD